MTEEFFRSGLGLILREMLLTYIAACEPANKASFVWGDIRAQSKRRRISCFTNLRKRSLFLRRVDPCVGGSVRVTSAAQVSRFAATRLAPRLLSPSAALHSSSFFVFSLSCLKPLPTLYDMPGPGLDPGDT